MLKTEDVAAIQAIVRGELAGLAVALSQHLAGIREVLERLVDASNSMNAQQSTIADSLGMLLDGQSLLEKSLIVLEQRNNGERDDWWKQAGEENDENE